MTENLKKQLEDISDTGIAKDGKQTAADIPDKSVTPISTLEQYIAGWRIHDAATILATLTPDCVVIESFGPIYRGHDRIAQWVSTWHAGMGRVIDWTIHDLRSLGDVEVAEWTFYYTRRGDEKTFDGATIARLQEGKIAYLREYATTAALYDWQGMWPAS